MLRGALCAMGEPVLQWKAKMKERQRIPLASFIEGLGGILLAEQLKLQSVRVVIAFMRAGKCYECWMLQKRCSL